MLGLGSLIKGLGSLPWKKILKRATALSSGYGAGVFATGACEGGGIPIPQTPEEAQGTLFMMVAFLVLMEIRSPRDEGKVIEKELGKGKGAK